MGGIRDRLSFERKSFEVKKIGVQNALISLKNKRF